ncbi:MAG: hypothetical protein ACO1NU_08470 [Arcticibacter sp.]
MKDFNIKQIDINSDEVWEDVIEVAFLTTDDTYVSLREYPMRTNCM